MILVAHLFLSLATVLLLVAPFCHGGDSGEDDDSLLRLPTFVDSHMVLQREPHQARIWGWASRLANVTADLNHGQVSEFSIASSTDGSWSIDFPPQPAGAGHAIEITDGVTKIVLQDIAFGDVYLCSGQSNMEMSVSAVFNAGLEIEDSIHYPDVRLATVNRTIADTPQTNVGSKANYIWAPSSSEAINGSHFGVYSATCYFFGRELYKSFNGTVPIGLLTSCWGGQPVEVFSSPDALADTSCGGTRPVGSDSKEESRRWRIPGEEIHTMERLEPSFTTGTGDDVFGDYVPPKPTELWNAMIHPLLPMRFAGVLWYQGEANANDPVSYACRFPAMISDWRTKFHRSTLSFFYVQLAGFSPGSTWPWMRAAQGAALALPHVGMVAAIDLGDPESPLGAIHPRRKQEVGRRLSLSVRAIQYQERGGLVYTGPTLSGVQLHSEPTHSMATLSFVPGTADGLHLQGAAACTHCCQQPPYEVLGANRNWTRVAMAHVRNGDEVVLVTAVGTIYGIRYAWEPRPECSLYNGSGGPDDHGALPAAPFIWCATPTGKGDWTHDGCQIKEVSSS
jgi:sialate O-acetylesterase